MCFSEAGECIHVRKGVDDVNYTGLKKIVLFLVLLFLVQGCAVYVRGHGEYYEHPHHYYYYGYWR